MKKLKFVLLAMVMAVSYTGCQSNKNQLDEPEEPVIVSPATVSYSWQSAYENKLSEFMKSTKYKAAGADGISVSRFDLCDINSDGIPELIISPDNGAETMCEIYTYSGNALSQVGETGTNGSLKFLPAKDLILEEYSGKGFTTGKYMAYENGEFLAKFTYYDNTPSAASGTRITHEINGEDVNLPEYDAFIAEFTSEPVFSIGRKYSFGSKSIEYAVYYSESWNGVMSDEWKSQYSTKLNEIYSSKIQEIEGEENAKVNAAFEICDLNGDDIPELIVSSGNLEQDSCSIFYFSGENTLNQLDGTYGTNGTVELDIEQHVFYSTSNGEMQYWSLGNENFSASEYKTSGSVMQLGRKNLLSPENIHNALGMPGEFISEEEPSTEPELEIIEVVTTQPPKEEVPEDEVENEEQSEETQDKDDRVFYNDSYYPLDEDLSYQNADFSEENPDYSESDYSDESENQEYPEYDDESDYYTEDYYG